MDPAGTAAPIVGGDEVAVKREFTTGGWQVRILKDAEGHVVERLIFTTWKHGQLDSEVPVVGGVTTVRFPEGHGDPGAKVYHGVHIGEDDAHLIAHTPDLLEAVKKDQEELCAALCPAQWKTEDGQPHRDRCVELAKLIRAIEEKPE